MSLRQLAFTFSACGWFTNKNDITHKFKEIGLDKAFFKHDMAYVDFKALPTRAASDNELRDKA